MLDIFKKKFELVAPVSGMAIDLSKVPDQVFAQRMAGDGIAIDSTGDVITAPASGLLTLIFRTNHAFGITLDNGIELLVHVGLDTVELEGEGFERIAKQGVRVNVGDPIIRVNRELITSKGCSLITPVLVTNMDKLGSIKTVTDKQVTGGKDVVVTYKLK
jgi:sugar PTS system EIIA component